MGRSDQAQRAHGHSFNTYAVKYCYICFGRSYFVNVVTIMLTKIQISRSSGDRWHVIYFSILWGFLPFSVSVRNDSVLLLSSIFFSSSHQVAPSLCSASHCFVVLFKNFHHPHNIICRLMKECIFLVCVLLSDRQTCHTNIHYSAAKCTAVHFLSAL